MDRTYLHVWPTPRRHRDGVVVVSASIECPGSDTVELWYQVDERWKEAITEHGDPFVIATVFLAMRHKLPLFVHGPVSPSLLSNLEEFQAIWHCWKPESYQSVEIRAESEQEASPSPTGDAIACYSGGIDGAFTVLRHSRGTVGRRSRHLAAALLIQGFDVPLTHDDAFIRNVQSAEMTLRPLHLPLASLKTNWRSLRVCWEDAFAAAAAACQHLFRGLFNHGLLGSSEPYSFLMPWGSTPLTDPLLSSDSFRLVHDGAEFTRVEKVRVLAEWPDFVRTLRVCWAGERTDRNCGRCEKCIRTILDFRAIGAVLPPAFESDVTDDMIRMVPIGNAAQRNEFQDVLNAAIAAGYQGERWVKTLVKRLQDYDRSLRNVGPLQLLRRRIQLRSRLGLRK